MRVAITPVQELVKRAKSEITTLAPDHVSDLVKSGSALLVDIRDIRELERDGRIPGAFHAPRGMLEFWVDPKSPYHKPELDGKKKLVLFCASAWRSALAAKTVQDMGLVNVAELAGGFSQWKKEGRPVER